MTLKFNRVCTVVEIHVCAKFHRAKCSGSLVIVSTEKNTPTKIIQPVATSRAALKCAYFRKYDSSRQTMHYEIN